jgi:hypothetical protein
MGLAVRFDTQKAVKTERLMKCLWHIFSFKFFNFCAFYFPEFELGACTYAVTVVRSMAVEG